MEVAFLIASIAGILMSSYGAYTAAQAQNAQADFQSKIAARNAETARDEAAFARKAAGEAEQAHREKVRQLLARQRASMAASGIDINSATYQDILEDTRAAGELDALAIQFSGELDAWKAEQTALNLGAQGQLYSMSKSNPYLATSGTLLAGLGDTGMAYKRYQNTKNEGTASKGVEA